MIKTLEKKLARARQESTGERYTTALAHVRKMYPTIEAQAAAWQKHREKASETNARR